MRLTIRSLALCLLGLLAVSQPGRAETPPPKAKAVKKFVNSKEGLTGDRADHYADFSVEHPEDWTVTRVEGGRASNFVDIERGIKIKDGSFTFEKFSAGTFWGKGTGSEFVLAKVGEELKAAARKELVEKFKTQFLAGFPNSKITSEGVIKLGKLEGYEIRLAAHIILDEGTLKEIKTDPKLKPYFKDDVKRLDIWGRFVMVPDPNGGENGLFVAMLGTSAAPELKEEKDLGVKGELPVLINSLRLGKPAKP